MLVAELICDILQKKVRNEIVKWTVFDRNLIEKIIEDHNLPGRKSANILRKINLTPLISS